MSAETQNTFWPTNPKICAEQNANNIFELSSGLYSGGDGWATILKRIQNAELLFPGTTAASPLCRLWLLKPSLFLGGFLWGGRPCFS